MFRKDYKTRYVNTCYPVRDGQFIIAGLNIVDPVDMEVFSNKKGAFEYEVTVLGDMNGEAYGRVDTVGTMVQISRTNMVKYWLSFLLSSIRKIVTVLK